jgi:hypothetical protein
MIRSLDISEAEILARVVAATDKPLSADAAQSLLEIRFDGKTKRQIQGLLRKNNRGTINVDERIVLDRYVRVGQLIDVLHARAHLALGQADVDQ